ncbi:hypothetical protein BD289DRAFT_9185 [Coniella lustricola]|uniref:Rhodopsin domain-containing protein n=1 Tax=Coniella lustricola TaxID=2025994 RepID=A0A2T3AK39_9PEZI|nr:hypothetical protein BD289DRAFT_9185 [Coniella lustricola]
MSQDGPENPTAFQAPKFLNHPVDAGLALAIMSVVIPVICTLTVGLRSYWRFWAKKGAWGWDDVLAVWTLLAFVVSCAFSFLTAKHGIGSPDIAQTDFVKVWPELMTFAIFYLLALALVKTSVALSVLRISFQRRYRWPILVLAICTILVYTYAIIWLVAVCGALFTRRVETACKSWQTRLHVVVTTTTLVTDAGCAFIPMFVVRNLRLSRRSKIGLMAALSIGMLPFVAAVIRIPYSIYWNHPTSERDVYFTVMGPILSLLEVGLALIGASLPAIGGMFRCFHQSDAMAPICSLDIDMALDPTAPPAAHMDIERGMKWRNHSSAKSMSTMRSTWDTRGSSSAGRQSSSQSQSPVFEPGRNV